MFAGVKKNSIIINQRSLPEHFTAWESEIWMGK